MSRSARFYYWKSRRRRRCEKETEKQQTEKLFPFSVKCKMYRRRRLAELDVDDISSSWCDRLNSTIEKKEKCVLVKHTDVTNAKFYLTYIMHTLQTISSSPGRSLVIRHFLTVFYRFACNKLFFMWLCRLDGELFVYLTRADLRQQIFYFLIIAINLIDFYWYGVLNMCNEEILLTLCGNSNQSKQTIRRRWLYEIMLVVSRSVIMK